ncbi:hypothetical protein BaRGS_00019818 [Batillaria attramentaria]|uniref:SRCR domain-containing protein n=1 Tax=Batillaria attramentaria TaxID=370345 RepID=A0ABD0KNQ5_9CAEN
MRLVLLVLLAALPSTLSFTTTASTTPSTASYSYTAGPDYSGSALTIGYVEALVTAVEADAKELLNDLSAATTLCDVAMERLVGILDQKLAAVTLKDKQQHELISLLLEQIKSLQHRLDVALATAASVNQRAQDTATQLTTSVSVDLSDVSSVNTQQGQMMMDLTDQVAEHKDYVIMRINGSVDYVEAKLYEVKDEIYGVHDAVQDRKCEYGFFGVHIEHGIGDAHVQFKTVFDVTPNVSISMVGFTSHLDQHSYSKHGHHGDYLALDKLVDSHDVDESGFSASVLDVSSGNVQLKTVYCSWMACQNLDRMVDVSPPTTTNPPTTTSLPLTTTTPLEGVNFGIIALTVSGVTGTVCAPDDLDNDAVVQNFLRIVCGLLGLGDVLRAVATPTGATDFWDLDPCTTTSGDNLETYGQCAVMQPCSGTCGTCGINLTCTG